MSSGVSLNCPPGFLTAPWLILQLSCMFTLDDSGLGFLRLMVKGKAWPDPDGAGNRKYQPCLIDSPTSDYL